MGKKRSCIIFIAVLLLLYYSTTAALAQSSLWGKYRGTVLDVIDPLGLGRIKAVVPEVSGSEATDWALPVFPFAGLNHGLILIPEVGDHVWIEFEQGDPNYPIWTGTWLTEGDMPIPNLETKRMLETRNGHKILVDDSANKLELIHASGPKITMTADDITLKVGTTTLAVTAAGVYINNKLFKTK
jgi:uncharacterized protein involved in type VI secretion and phage assembly